MNAHDFSIVLTLTIAGIVLIVVGAIPLAPLCFIGAAVVAISERKPAP